jgi:hypothetical protein
MGSTAVPLLDSGIRNKSSGRGRTEATNNHHVRYPKLPYSSLGEEAMRLRPSLAVKRLFAFALDSRIMPPPIPVRNSRTSIGILSSFLRSLALLISVISRHFARKMKDAVDVILCCDVFEDAGHNCSRVFQRSCGNLLRLEPLGVQSTESSSNSRVGRSSSWSSRWYNQATSLS